MSAKDHQGEAEAVSARFWVRVVVGPGFCVAGRRQEVTIPDMGDGIMSEIVVPRAWADSGVIAEATDGRREQGRRPSRKEVRWVLLPTKFQPLEHGVIQ